MEKNLKLTIRDEDIIEMERIKSLHNLTDDEMFSYLLRLDALADTDSLTPTERRHQIERARQASAERSRTRKERPEKRKKSSGR
jgi:hypothetical protein